MIAQSERTALLEKVQGESDYKKAAELYQEKTGRYIHYRYLYKFLSGQRHITGKKPGSHQPLDMYTAVVDAIKKREMEVEEMTGKAREIRQALAA